ncbi:prephenate dehydratase [Geitlerinema sp. PCC 9228]|uniref:prephenate dehydratase n=1 Tax=Geitlerinema sp. PCC 9228 TaxID=111611 RepID=UPI0008F9BEC0|nr:prephenate dehydratase [Geitlerinema sp. PCC 9228]
MNPSIAYLGPPGTYTEAATLAYAEYLQQTHGWSSQLTPRATIAQTLQAAAAQEVAYAVVPVENSIEGGVTVTLDTLWQLECLQIHKALVLPITHSLISRASERERITKVYSHPQALAQCQGWLAKQLPQAELVATPSTSEAVLHAKEDTLVAAVASIRAAQLYGLPILAQAINDYPENCTRFWVVSAHSGNRGSHTSLAFSLPANVPGALLKPLQVFAQRGINLSRIESRPTKLALGEYLFFIDLEADSHQTTVQSALEEIRGYTEVLKLFGSYDVLSVQPLAAPPTL